MAMRITLICQGETTATVRSGFPQDEPLTATAVEKARIYSGYFADKESALCAPQYAARQTAALLGFNVIVDNALTDLNYGRWAGKRIKDIMNDDVQSFHAWLEGAPAPEGESVQELLTRCTGWLDKHLADQSSIYIITSPSIIRAMMMVVLGASFEAFNRIDVQPLSLTYLTSNARRWSLCQRNLP